MRALGKLLKRRGEKLHRQTFNYSFECAKLHSCKPCQLSKSLKALRYSSATLERKFFFTNASLSYPSGTMRKISHIQRKTFFVCFAAIEGIILWTLLGGKLAGSEIEWVQEKFLPLSSPCAFHYLCRTNKAT